MAFTSTINQITIIFVNMQNNNKASMGYNISDQYT